MRKLIIPVILCGGSGTRLWPASRESHPKQFLNLLGDFSLLQNTMLRALRISGASAENLVIITLDLLAEGVKQQLTEIDPRGVGHILCEPSARNTAAAVALAACYIEKTFGPEAIMWVLPADHHIGNENALAAAYRRALGAAEDRLMTFGIRPTRPDTGYGYIRLGDEMNEGEVFAARAFVEKPDAATAQIYLEAGDYLWNSGMFLFKVSAVLEEYNTHGVDILRLTRAAMARGKSHQEPSSEDYAGIPAHPFDKAIMEKSAKVTVVPCEPEWSDIGSWESLWEMRPKDMNGNAIEGRAACVETRNCLIQTGQRLVACAGVENLVIVETSDALLIADKNNPEALRALVKSLQNAGALEVAGKVIQAFPHYDLKAA